ncbi:hypothetical protein P4S72_29655 [Vibrio sp. PP-XX7]
MPEKVGTNKVTVNGQLVQPGTIAPQFTIESRGGKIANSHEGEHFITRNCRRILISPCQQQLYQIRRGQKRDQRLIVRKVLDLWSVISLGKPRLNPQPEGLEEFPSASNMVMNLRRANKKANNGLVNINAVYREGICQPGETAA